MDNITNKRKIINDPVHGFINFPFDIIYDLIEHPYVQRLRRIRQLGVTHYVYPGANHTRFQHVVGACYLLIQAIENIRSKGHNITNEEAEASAIAILLHDLGHGPFSHTLENTLIQGVHHEALSLLLMNKLNKEFDGKLSLAIEIFEGVYKKRFLHELVSSQLDMDRMDYLRRDSFFTGVTEGAIGSERIIKMLNVVNDKLVVEAKGIYSIEKFLIARRLMYWQVYLHKTVVAAENILTNMLKRATYLVINGVEVFTTKSLQFLMDKTIRGEFVISGDIQKNEKLIAHFNQIDDSDIFACAKMWQNSDDQILRVLASGFIQRMLPRIIIRNTEFSIEEINSAYECSAKLYNVSINDAAYFVQSGVLSNSAYDISEEKIQILDKHGNLTDVTEASDVLNISVLNKKVKKYYLCLPKNCTI
jgi:HD superfamily phosphohydrolase